MHGDKPKKLFVIFDTYDEGGAQIDLKNTKGAETEFQPWWLCRASKIWFWKDRKSV